MPEKICPVKKIPCPRTITTKEGTDTTLNFVERLSAHGDSENPIDTRSIAADYTFKQNSPRACIELYADFPILGVPFKSCGKCTWSIEVVLKSLNMI